MQQRLIETLASEGERASSREKPYRAPAGGLAHRAIESVRAYDLALGIGKTLEMVVPFRI